MNKDQKILIVIILVLVINYNIWRTHKWQHIHILNRYTRRGIYNKSPVSGAYTVSVPVFPWICCPEYDIITYLTYYNTCNQQ